MRSTLCFFNQLRTDSQIKMTFHELKKVGFVFCYGSSIAKSQIAIFCSCTLLLEKLIFKARFNHDCFSTCVINHFDAITTGVVDGHFSDFSALRFNASFPSVFPGKRLSQSKKNGKKTTSL